MPKSATKRGNKSKRPIQPYEHAGKQRINNPPVGLVTPQTDPDLPTHKTYDYIQLVPSLRQPLDYDPHLPPQLVWAGKKLRRLAGVSEAGARCRNPERSEGAPFEVHTASLHVHERIDPRTIIEAVRRNGNGLPEQPSLFERRLALALFFDLSF